jgi:hypothetical protein
MQEQQIKEKKETNGTTVLIETDTCCRDTCCTSATESLDNKQGQL